MFSFHESFKWASQSAQKNVTAVIKHSGIESIWGSDEYGQGMAEVENLSAKDSVPEEVENLSEQNTEEVENLSEKNTEEGEDLSRQSTEDVENLSEKNTEEAENLSEQPSMSKYTKSQARPQKVN